MSMLDDLFSALGSKEGKTEKEDGKGRRLRFAGMYGASFSEEYGERKQAEGGTEDLGKTSLQK